MAIRAENRRSPHAGGLDAVLRLLDMISGEVRRSAQLPRGGRSVTFGPTGRMLYGDRKAIENELVYSVERRSRSVEVLKPFEFNKLAGCCRP